MPEVYESTVVSAPADEVWTRIRDFGGLDVWYPGLESGAVRLENDRPGDAVGAIRTIDMPDGETTIREQLVEHSDLNRFYTYTILDYPLPLEDYHATIRVLEVTDEDESFVEWSTRFNVEDDLVDEAVENIHTVFREGLDALKDAYP